ncbi:hypothetical protein [Saliterribacillus persicus]|uniref:Methyl-accepting chemotaxis protein n=1 Tax=Saliterribacillus persicus TaxID=930114 RepID=A0A368X852_9BACI|nr:hypothetical protein [Saliterribacillus persicus]RCW63376.1 hypothetical protein DFR57_11843 [Saliterribacillus persicus]
MKETASHHVTNAKEVAETSGEMNKSVEKINQGLVTVKDSSGNLHQHINQYQI